MDGVKTLSKFLMVALYHPVGLVLFELAIFGVLFVEHPVGQPPPATVARVPKVPTSIESTWNCQGPPTRVTLTL
eukprot:jgi/Tetstr1/426100/TSEL_016430.t1